MQLCREQRGTVTTPLSRNPPALFEKRVTSETHSSIAQTACCTAARECSSARRLSRDVRVIRYNFEKSFSTLRKCHEPRSSCMSIVPSTESVERHLRVMKRRTRSEHIWSASPPPNHAVWKAATAALMVERGGRPAGVPEKQWPRLCVQGHEPRETAIEGDLPELRRSRFRDGANRSSVARRKSP